MSTFRGKVSFSLGLLATIVMLAPWGGCDRGSTRPVVKVTRYHREVEVAPGEWVSIEGSNEELEIDVAEHVSLNIPLPGDQGRTQLRIPWQGKRVLWEGSPVPFSLRAWEGKLYVIGLDRTDLDKCRFRYYREEGERFVEIGSEEFPKRIATQNMWLSADDSSTGKGGERIYDLQLARQIDPDNLYFPMTLTAQVWLHLNQGRDYFETAREIDKQGVRDFKDKYDPIPLPTIIRTPPGWPDSMGGPTTTAKD